MPKCHLIKHSDAYSKTSRGLWQYYRYKPALNPNNEIIGFYANNNNSN